ncbi:hypothetical protein D9619_011843 [Psilocybe cf. subviscida]|uniref:Aminoglycoside phosphotransferase domain-containing protein n=1 Tax=Psilocybe cf. subviscida TaxID=2480587 RepID=A0A8H5B0D2_9AGAR|nr:hypothetical protein D9619_011843 [Psilocybe cf. subviscida]
MADAADNLVLVLCPETTPIINLQASASFMELDGYIANMEDKTQLSEVDELCDQEILELFEDRVSIDSTAYRRVPQLTRTAMKWAQDMDLEEDPTEASEAIVLNLLIAKTKIPVPRARRLVTYEMDNVIVMDYIKGQTLDKIWLTMSVWKEIRIAFILRRYIRQLHRLEAPPGAPPGPLSSDATKPRKCDCSSIFGDVKSCREPFASYAEFSTFWNDRHRIGLNDREIPTDDPLRKELFDDTSPLVLSHMDLNPCNMILGEDGRLWIIDWAWAG